MAKIIGLKIRRFLKHPPKILVFFLLTFYAYGLEVQTIFGPLELDDALLNIYNLEEIQRLKELDHSGSAAYWYKIPKLNKLDYSLSTLWLVKNYGGDLKEQIAALTHIISDAVFSQVADVVFGQKDYQKNIHEWFLNQTDITQIVSWQRLSIKDIMPTNPEFIRLNQTDTDIDKNSKESTFEMNARNIAYMLHMGLVFNIVSKDDVKKIQQSLHFQDGKWCFLSQKAAKQFAWITLVMTKKYNAAPGNIVIQYFTGKILKRAIMLQRVTTQKLQKGDFGEFILIDKKNIDKARDLNFGTDKDILKAIDECDDSEIKNFVAFAKTPTTAFRILSDGEGEPDIAPIIKFQGINPWIYYKYSKKFKRLSEIDKSFKKAFSTLNADCKKSYKIQIETKQ